MTRDEIGKMRQSDERGFNFLVSEKVMGWKRRAVRVCGGTETVDIVEKTRILTDGFWAKHELENYGVPPDFAGNAHEDYSVLKLVRETWTEEQQKQMADELDRIYETRNEFALLAYRPGDHAEAALRVVTADAEGGK